MSKSRQGGSKAIKRRSARITKPRRREAKGNRSPIAEEQIDIVSTGRLPLSIFGKPKPYEDSSYAFGFIAASSQKSDVVPIIDSRQVDPDFTLMNVPLKVSLDTLMTKFSPGNGQLQILVNFGADCTSQGQAAALNFAETYPVKQGEQAGLNNVPLFTGLKVDPGGVLFTCQVIFVTDTRDQDFSGVLKSVTFQKGLTIVDALNPALPVISEFATGIAQALIKNHSNQQIQNFKLGLDFGRDRTGSKLGEGSYVAVQTPNPNAWDWTKWTFNQKSGQIAGKDDDTQPIPNNYLVFSIEKMPTAPA